ncbi:hypothetical protein GOBAR_DD07109 [Gossypium barbadense]|nr:hypothetical protein GOBAR_DD07109 [Gossypium barbadense]
MVSLKTQQVQFKIRYGSKKYESSSELVNLRYHMGPVLSGSITVHTIWGGRWQKSQKKIIREFFGLISAVNAKHPSVASGGRQ